MDPSSEPGRDDYGLPPVDVEIPDDARDLDRDVQAYRRELRALRRRSRIRRLARPIGRRGLLIPLIVGCLVLTLLSGTLLTMLAGRQVTEPPLRTSAPRTPSRGGASGENLPNAPVTVDGKQVGLRSLVPAVLAWVPQSCMRSCLLALKKLTQQADEAHVQVYLVGTDQVAPELSSLATEVNQLPSQVVNDSTNALGFAYRPMGLTAILADREGRVGAVVKNLPTGDQRLVAELPALASPAQSAAANPPPAASIRPKPRAS